MKMEELLRLQMNHYQNRRAVLQNTLATSTKVAALDSLSGQIYGSAQALTFQNSETVNKDLTNRLTMLGTLDNQNGGVWFSGIHGTGKLAQDGFGEAKQNLCCTSWSR